jgi:pimeloyl-ACP methyl ester carboxylesterase
MLTVTSADTTTLSLRSWGPADAPLIVLIHGLGMSVESWGVVPELLATDHRVVAYDLRGHGHSGRAATGDYSLDAHAADLAAVLGALDRQSVLVGHSLGGGIIVQAAHRGLLSDVRGVVFAGSGGSAVTAPGLPARGLPGPVGRRLRRTWLDVLRVGALVAERLRWLDPWADRVTRRVAFAPGDPQSAVRQVRLDFTRTRRAALAGTTLASVSHNGLLHARELAVPCLVLHGDHDPEVPDHEAQALVDRLPDGELLPLEGGGHMVPLTRPTDVAEQVRRWVRRTVLAVEPSATGES